MRNSRTLAASLIAVAAVGVLNAFAQQSGPKVGGKAPAFTAEATDGKKLSLASLIKNGPVHLYFINDGCPVNHRAAPFFKKLDAAYKGKGNIVGVINGDVKTARAWAKSYKTTFKIIADPDLKIIHAYGAEASPSAVTVSKAGKIVRIHTTGSEKSMKTLNADVAKGIGAKLASVNFSGAPEGVG